MPTTTASKSVGTGVVARFAGQPFVLAMRLSRAIEELQFYKVNGRHRTAAETNEPLKHAVWRQDAIDLCEALAASIRAGELEPPPPAREVDE